MIFLLEDGNTKLKGRKFYLGDNIRKHLENTLKNFKNNRSNINVDGWKRINNLLNMDGIEYNEMKRLKNYFDNYNGDGNDDEFKLNGGLPMKNWVINTLNTATKNLANQKEAMKLVKGENDEKPQVRKERRTATKSIPSPTKIDTSFTNPVEKVNNNEIIKYDSLVKTPSINEHKLIKLSEEQVNRLKNMVF